MPAILTGMAVGPVLCRDFDGDGYRDIVTAAAVARGTAGSGFEPPIDLDAPPDSGPIACGDFSGDDIADLVRLQAGIAGPIGFATLLPGNGDGSVPVFPRVPAGDSVWSVTTADVDDNNHLDLLVANIGTPWGSFHNGSVAVLFGNGDGSLDPLVSHAAGDYVRRVAAGNLDTNPLPEMVVTNFDDGTASLLVNDGAGGYGPRVPLSVGANPEAVTIGDFNADTNPDIAVTNYGLGATPAAVTILFLDGNAGVLSSTTLSLTGHAAVGIAGIDLNDDNIPDLAVACAGRYYGGGFTHFGLYVRLNNGDGTFAPETHYATTYLPRTLNPAHGAHDGAPDLIVTTHGPTQAVLFVGEVVTFQNDGHGSFPTSIPTPLTHDHFAAQCVDFDGDGQDDLAVPYLAAAVVSILWGDGSGSFPAQTHYATAAEPRGVAVGDYDENGRQDLAVAHGEINELGILLAMPSAAEIDGQRRARTEHAATTMRSAPNPFSNRTRIRLDLPRSFPHGTQTIEIYDLQGRCVARPARRTADTGQFEFVWDGCDTGGRRLPAGVYSCRLSGARQAAVHRLVYCSSAVGHN
ncbi:MAG: hypothetical protein GY778_22395 [bacterium]|nr:hypothetical protein [bacterium]